MPVLMLSVLAFEISILVGGAVSAWEPTVQDVFVRWRYHLLPSPAKLVHPDIAAIGIDSVTQEKFGRFGAGSWMTRKPFVDQLKFVENYLKPSVLAYDIIFEDSLGRLSRKYGRVTESDARLENVIKEVTHIRANPSLLAQSFILDEINRFSIEQGNDWMANALASLNTRVPVVLGYYYRGGWMDPQVFAIQSWSDEDIFGDSETGNEGRGTRIPYLADTCIPGADIHFPEDFPQESYEWAQNAKLPARELLDYSVLGFVNCPRDADGIVRRVPLVIGLKYRNSKTGKERMMFTPSLALLPYLIYQGVPFPLQEGSVEVFLGREIVIRTPGGIHRVPIDRLGQLTLNFNAAFADFNAINLIDVAPSSQSEPELKAKLAADVKARVDGKIALIGVTATGVDSGPTPLSSKTPFMHIHLTAINNMLTDSYLIEPSGRERLWLYAIVCFIVTLICCIERSARLGPVAILLAVGYFASAFVLVYGSVRIVPVITPLLYIVLCTFSVMTYRFFTEEKAKRKIRGMFSTMVSDRVLAYLEQNPGSFSLKGHHADVTVFFSDVGGFTSISEQLPPERLTGLLNRYFTTVTDCIMDRGGYLDKYVGDGVMAVWGAPFPDKEHAVEACRAALEQVRLLKKLNPELKAEFGTELSMRIGLNSGEAIAGNMGSSKKFQYTVMGDTVNLASRLEPANKDFGTSIIIGPGTMEAVKEIMMTRILARIIVKGKTEAIPIYELVGERGSLSDEDERVLWLYNNAMVHFLAREWDRSREVLDEIAALREDDGPSLFLRQQVVLMKKNPPPAGWQGEYIREKKD